MAFAEKLAIVQIGVATNLVPNPSFEYDTVGSLPASWGIPGGFTTKAVSEGWAKRGIKSLRLTTPSDASERDVTLGGIPVIAGTSYTLSGFLNVQSIAAGKQIKMLVRYYNAKTEIVGEKYSSIVTTTGITEASVTLVAPATAVTAEVSPAFFRGTTGVADTYLDAISFAVTGTLSFDGDSAGAKWLGTPGDSVSEEPAVETLIDLNDDDHFLIKAGTFKVVAPVLQRVEAADQRRWGGSRQVAQTEENGVVSWEAGVVGGTEEECLATLELLLAQLAGNPYTTFLLWQPPGATEPTLYEMRGVGQYEPVYEPAQFGGAQLFVCQITIPVAPLAQGLPVRVLASASTTLPAVFSLTDIPGDAPAKAEVSIETGTEPNQNLITGTNSALGLAVDATYIYWANSATGYIGRAKLNGTEPNETWLKTGGGPAGVAVNSSHIFWTNFTTNDIGRATIAGGTIETTFITGADQPFGIAIDTEYIYWANYGSGYLGRATLAGGSPEPKWDKPVTGAAELAGLTISGGGGELYFTNPTAGSIEQFTITTKATLVLVTGASSPLGVAVEGGYIYWPNLGTGTIGRASLTGPELEQSWVSGANLPEGIAANGSTVFWTNRTSGTIGSAAREDNPPIWALLSWAAQPTPGLAEAPFGLLEGDNATLVSGWKYETVAGAFGGEAWFGTSATAAVYWDVDPATMVPDSFSGELAVEVWARVLLTDKAAGTNWIVSAQPQDGLGYGAARFTDEWGSAGRRVQVPAGFGEVWRMTRLGTLHLLVNPLAPRVWRIWVEGTENSGAGAAWGLNYLLLAPSTQRACSPSGKPNNVSFPRFITNVGPTVKTIRHDLSAVVAKPGKYGHPDHGLGGQLLEIPSGDTDLLVKLSSLVPDAPEESAASEQTLHTAVVRLTVTPRYFLTQA